MLTLPSAPTSRKLLILGEAPGEEEEATGTPFVGASGKFLRTLFRDAGLDINQWHITNVLSQRPPRNDIKATTCNVKEAKAQGLDPKRLARLGKRYMLPQWKAQADATQSWITSQGFDFILCLGGTALWLLTGDNRIGLFRGNFFRSQGCECLATYHPAAVLREFKNRPISWSDLRKVRQHLEGSIQPPLRRSFIYSPTWDEMDRAYEHFRSDRSRPMGVDIETAPSIGQITTISFAWPEYAICIPIWDKAPAEGKPHNVYATERDEVRAWRMIDKFAKLPNPKVFQNGLYDMQYCLEAPIQIRFVNTTEDTNIMSHALEPELPKDLGMLASTRLNEPGWKQMRTKHADEKAED